MAPEERIGYMLFSQMTRMCREKGAIKHDDRLDCLAQGVKYFTDALAISAHEQMIMRKRDEWNEMEQAWLDDPLHAANSMALGMSMAQSKRARQIRGSSSVSKWV